MRKERRLRQTWTVFVKQREREKEKRERERGRGGGGERDFTVTQSLWSPW